MQRRSKIRGAIIMAAALFLASCGGNEQAAKGETNAADSTPATSPVPETTTAEVAKKDGKALIEASDCRTCHTDNQKLIGPPYAEVAKKYKETDVDALAKKVVDGGMGVWGQIPMSPHPNISAEDAKEMVKYILTIK